MPVPIFNQALQVYYKDKSKFIIPKKDTDDYNKVIKIMNEIKNKTAKPVKIIKSNEKPVKIIKSTEKPLQVSTNGDIKIK